jgi:hypothetical protein
MIHRILKTENYIGNIVYNRTSRKRPSPGSGPSRTCTNRHHHARRARNTVLSYTRQIGLGQVFFWTGDTPQTKRCPSGL